jgi:hypothetical protein
MIEFTWQGVFIAYTIIGVATLVIMYAVANLLSSRTEKEHSNSEILKATRARIEAKRGIPKIDFDFILEKILVPIIGTVFVVTIWPVLLWLKIKEVLWPYVPPVEKQFSIERKDLLTMLTMESIEAQEMVFDPLGAVPNLPFGHLYKVWSDFKSNFATGCEIWTFSAPWEEWGRVTIRSGYVIVVDEAIGPHWVLDFKTVEREDNDIKPEETKSWNVRWKNKLRQLSE